MTAGGKKLYLFPFYSLGIRGCLKDDPDRPLGPVSHGRGVAEPRAELASARGWAAGRRPQPGAGRRTGAETGPAGSPAGGRPSALRCGRTDRDPELSTEAERVSERRVSAPLEAGSCLHFHFSLVPARHLLEATPARKQAGHRPQPGVPGSTPEVRGGGGGGWRGGVSSGAEMSGWLLWVLGPVCPNSWR
ncbi:hypothetical protein HispidOSU_009103 [Sigmodon hispidus]